MTARISPHAIVDRSAELADDVVVGPFSYVGPDVRIAPACVLDNNVTVTGRTTLGSGTHLHPMTVVGAAPRSDRTPGRCVLGSRNAIREQVTIYAGDGEDEVTRIGDDNLIMIVVQIGPGARIGGQTILANCMLIEAGACLEDYVRASAFSAVQAGTTVGAYTFVGGYAVVDHDAPPFAMLHGCPYRIRGVNTHNLTRCGFAEDDIRALKDAFRELFDPSGSRVDRRALERLVRERPANDHVCRLLASLGVEAAEVSGVRS